MEKPFFIYNGKARDFETHMQALTCEGNPTMTQTITAQAACTLAQLTQAFLAKADYNTADKLDLPCCDVPHALFSLAQTVVNVTNEMATAMAMCGDDLYKHSGHFVWVYEIEEPIAEAYLEILLDGGQGGFECIKKAIATGWKSAAWGELPAHFWETFDSVLDNTAKTTDPYHLKA